MRIGCPAGALLADEVLPESPLRQWVLSLPHALRFLLATNPAGLTQVLGVGYRTISRHLISQAGLTVDAAATGAVIQIRRFGSALNLNAHLHRLFPYCVYVSQGANRPLFRPVAGPSANELQRLVEQITALVGQVLETSGLIERGIENAWLASDDETGPLGGAASTRAGDDRGGGRRAPAVARNSAGRALRPGSFEAQGATACPNKTTTHI